MEEIRCDRCGEAAVTIIPLGNGILHLECSRCGSKHHRSIAATATSSDEIQAGVKIEACNCS